MTCGLVAVHGPVVGHHCLTASASYMVAWGICVAVATVCFGHKGCCWCSSSAKLNDGPSSFLPPSETVLLFSLFLMFIGCVLAISWLNANMRDHFVVLTTGNCCQLLACMHNASFSGDSAGLFEWEHLYCWNKHIATFVNVAWEATAKLCRLWLS